ncbi:muts domain V-domain-containing protein [Blastocladiella britannica]|nr:muts domain V-domain-containing protein [Blastocladiella britannica]
MKSAAKKQSSLLTFFKSASSPSSSPATPPVPRPVPVPGPVTSPSPATRKRPPSPGSSLATGETARPRRRASTRVVAEKDNNDDDSEDNAPVTPVASRKSRRRRRRDADSESDLDAFIVSDGALVSGSDDGDGGAPTPAEEDEEDDGNPGPSKRARLSSSSRAAASPVSTTLLGGKGTPRSVARKAISAAAGTTTGSPATASTASKRAASGTGRAGRGGTTDIGPSGQKYTPLEKQIVELKLKYPGVLLAVEVGYKYRFFGDDARVASELLRIVAWHDRNFLTASVPVPRISIHIRRLVRAGHKVGIVQQTETAALKSAGSNRAGPFTRDLTRMYTAATLIDEAEGDGNADSDAQLSAGGGSGGGQNYILALAPASKGGALGCALCAVDAGTAEIVVDEWVEASEDMLLELDARFAAILPVEVLVAGTLHAAVTNWVGRYCRSQPTPVRLETVDPPASRSAMLKSLSSKLESNGTLLEALQEHSEHVQAAADMALEYLSQFDLTNLPLLLRPYSAAFTFRLSATAMRALSVFPSPGDRSTTTTSLFSVINHTHTPSGARRLRQWVTHPLVDAASIGERADAVEVLVDELVAGRVANVVKGMRRVGDVQRVLAKIRLARISSKALWSFCSSWIATCDAVAEWSAELVASAGSSQPSMLTDIARAVVDTRAAVAAFFAQMDRDAANRSDRVDMWTGDELSDARAVLDDLVRSLSATAKEQAASVTGSVTTVSEKPYLIQVPKLRKVPASWVRVSATQQVIRYHSPELLELLKDRDVAQETLAAQAAALYGAKLLEFSTAAHAGLARAARALADFDCLLSLAAVARNPRYVRPTLVDQQVVQIQDGRHPVLDLTTNYVPNSIALQQSTTRCMVLSGPNMAGKSSIVRQVALSILLAQIGSRVPATSATLGVFDGIHVRMGAADDLARGASTFMVELRETNECIRQATARSLVILDELGRGTATNDGTAIAWAVLDHLVARTQCLTLFVTHFPPIARMQLAYPENVMCAHMGFARRQQHRDGDDGDGGGRSITFLYKLTPGAADASYGLNVAQMAGIPVAVVDMAHEKSREVAAAEEAIVPDEDDDGDKSLMELATAWSKKIIELPV